MQKSLFIVALFLCQHLHAQKLEGIWEGKLALNGDKKNSMTVRLEIIEQDSSIYGLLYTRGFEHNAVFGCDYFVTGIALNGRVNFKWQKVQRSVGMKEKECRSFDYLVLKLKSRDSSKVLEGNWVWSGGRSDFFNCTKVSDTVSDMATDEFVSYVNDLYVQYEQSGIQLPVNERLMKKVIDLQVDSSDIVTEFSGIDSSPHDSISVYINGNPVAEKQDLNKKPLRLRIRVLPEGVNDLVVVNESTVLHTLNIQLKIIHQGEVKLVTIHPGNAINSVVYFNCKNE